MSASQATPNSAPPAAGPAEDDARTTVAPVVRASFGSPGAVGAFVESVAGEHAHIRFCAYRSFADGSFEYLSGDGPGSRPTFVVELARSSRRGRELPEPRYTEMRYKPGHPEKCYASGVVFPDGTGRMFGPLPCREGKAVLKIMYSKTLVDIRDGIYPPGSRWFCEVVEVDMPGEWHSRPLDDGERPWEDWIGRAMSRARRECHGGGRGGSYPGVEVQVLDNMQIPGARRRCKASWPADKDLSKMVEGRTRSFWSVLYEPGTKDVVFGTTGTTASSRAGNNEQVYAVADALGSAKIF
ncbi:hypothetical protein DFJ74DRAFT_773353 [Hyaloraphidium curvatum]|nr:hypothetical protein DFJ74DRAFT_773353 [Hyaloraphidium curvatum]